VTALKENKRALAKKSRLAVWQGGFLMFYIVIIYRNIISKKLIEKIYRINNFLSIA